MLKKILSLSLAAAICFGCGHSVGAYGDEATVTAVGSEEATKQITLSDIKELAKKGMELSYDDLAPFTATLGPEAARSDMQVERYETDEGYYLIIGGYAREEIRIAELHRNVSEESIDILTEDVEAFIANTVTGTMPVPQTITTTTTTTAGNDDIYFGGTETLTLDDVRELAKKGSSLTWSDFKPYRGRDIGSGLYILEYVLEDGYTVLVGGVPQNAPMYILLCYGNERNSIDIRTEDVEAFIAEYSEGDSRYTIDENYVLFNKPVDVAWVMSDKNFDDYCKNNTYKFYVPDGSKYIILIGQYNVDVNELLNDPTMPDVDCTIQSYTVERSNGEITVEAGEEYFVPYPHNDEEAEAVFAQDHSIYSKVMELTGKDYFFRTVRARGDDKEINEKSLMISSSAKGRLFVTRETPDGGTVTAEQREEEGSGAGTKIFAVTASDESMYPEDSDPLHIPTSVLKVTRIDQGIVTNYELMESCGYLIQSKMKISSCKLGDVSGDGNFNVADIVLFQRWLLGQKPENFKNWQAADMDGSGELDVFDLAKMKRYLVETI